MRNINYYIVASVIFFLVSLSQPAYCVENSCGGSWEGLGCLIFGAIGTFFGGANLTWLANPLLILSMFISKENHKIAFRLSGASLFISISFLLFDSIIVNEAGHYAKITGYLFGYWLWVFSSLTIFIGNGIMLYNKEDQTSV